MFPETSRQSDWYGWDGSGLMHRYRLTWVLKYSSLVLGVSVCRIDVLLCCCIVSCHPSLGGRVGTRLLVVPRCRRLGVVPREFGFMFCSVVLER
jgi:hypothetical protein